MRLEVEIPNPEVRIIIKEDYQNQKALYVASNGAGEQLIAGSSVATYTIATFVLPVDDARCFSSLVLDHASLQERIHDAYAEPSTKKHKAERR